MTEVSTLKYNKAKNELHQQHMNALKSEKNKFKDDIEKVKKKNEIDLTEIQKDYNVKLNDEKIRKAESIHKIRQKYSKMIEDEESRQKLFIEDLKKSHSGKISEVKNSFETEYQRQQNERQELLAETERKFKLEQMKLES